MVIAWTTCHQPPWRPDLAGGYDGGMAENPYEAPRESCGLPNKTVVVALRASAIVFWTLAAIPAIAVLVPLLAFETAETRRKLPFVIYVMAAAHFILPSVGMAFLGAACWWHIRWLGMIGLLCILPVVVLLCFALLRS